jgi:sugar fermentation stimulation protein A
MDGGLYIAVFYLPRKRRITVGRLGTFVFMPGWYLYAGSAKKNLSARLNRHSLKDKPLRWHIDYLSVKAEMAGAVVIAEGSLTECEIARELECLYEPKIKGFGASDCRCRGHLFYAAEL